MRASLLLSFAHTIAAAAASVVMAPVLLAHPDKVEDRLLLHFATGTHPIEQSRWTDLTHRATAEIKGSPTLESIGPAQGLRLDGGHDWLLVAPDRAAATPFLPSRDFSAAAWVLLDDTRVDGGIVGFVQDNGDDEHGWVLGYDKNAFTFRLATVGTTDGDGRLTTVRAATPIVTGRWHHVAASYDGTTMRLFVNGALEGESTVRSGDISYPATGRLVIGAYADDNELHPLEGALQEVKLYARPLDAAEVARIAETNAGLIGWREPVNDALQFVVKPYLQAATADSISIMTEVTAPASLSVQYGPAHPLKLSATTEEAKTIQTVTVRGLNPHTRYFYRVIARDAAGNLARSEVATFQTMPGPDDAWAFGILGDTQRNPKITRRCADGIFALRPNFLLHCGDVVDDGFAKSQWVFDLFEPCARLFAHVPSFPVIGNHEKNSHWYYDYFHLPEPEYFYTFRCGNAEFFMVDSNKPCAPDSEQYAHLDKALATSTATWKFAAHHHPCFSSDENDYGDTWKGREDKDFRPGDGNARELIPLYEKHGVDIVFAGHIHSYERTWPILNMAINQTRGVRYIVSGGGGGGLEQAGPQRAWFSIHVQRGHHFCFATVHDRTIQFKAYDVDGRLFDTFELSKPVGR
ncbi:MAG: LamG-like jellyroll fold domain-containing protein [Verrucomicrobiales bacterium]